MSSQTHIFIIGGTGRIGQSVITEALSQGHQVTALVRKPDSLEPRTNLTLVTGSPTSSSDILKALISISNSHSTTSNPSTTKPQVAIVFTLGQTRINSSNPWSKSTSPAYFMSQSLEALIDTIRSNISTAFPSSSPSTQSTPNPTLNIDISKLIILSMFGTTNSFQHMSWPFRWTMNHSNMKQSLDDHNRIIEIVESSLAHISIPTSDITSPSTFPATEQEEQQEPKTDRLPIPFTVVRPSMIVFEAEGPIAEVKEWGDGSAEMGFMPKMDARGLVRFLVDRVSDTRFDGCMPVISN